MCSIERVMYLKSVDQNKELCTVCFLATAPPSSQDLESLSSVTHGAHCHSGRRISFRSYLAFELRFLASLQSV